ncbi:hypothetical protein WR25_18712 [Diploscapter pachys]|uniref:Uncharacterized protein n=1 Tax=Diploscapter pachys TaxID=2018661 RepID=A0A2A2KFU7_9BILA|nr:hypothetical protein WR25_18712 [Diploscapter pachys]
MCGSSVRQLEAPTSSSQIYSSHGYSCLFNSDCVRISADVVSAILLNVRTYLRVYALKVFERWFPSEDCVSSPNVLALLVIDGFINDVRKIPYVRIHSGSTKLNFALGNIQSEATNAIVQGWPMARVIADLVDDIGYALKELHELNGEVRDHSVPSWARRLFLVCAGLVAFALLVEWYIVRRKLGVQKSGGGLKISTGRSKTHLMF